MKKLIHLLLCVSFITSAFAVDDYQYRPSRHDSILDDYSAMTGLDLRLPQDPSAPYTSGYYNKARPVSNGVFVPFELSGADMAKIAAASAVAVLFFANDQEIMQFTQDNKNELTEKAAVFGEAFGDEIGFGAVAAGLVVGVVLDNDKVKSVALMGASALLITGLSNAVIKNTFKRQRPRGNNNDPYVFQGPYSERDSNYTSFPSGHTAAAFALATVIAETTKDESTIIPILAYSAAAVTAWSRVHDRAHWGSDVLIGALVGHLIAKNVVNAKTAKKGFYIVPTMDFQGGYGINVTYTGRIQEKPCSAGLSQEEAVRVCLEKGFEAAAKKRLFR